jgi:hypothetical protein
VAGEENAPKPAAAFQAPEPPMIPEGELDIPAFLRRR